MVENYGELNCRVRNNLVEIWWYILSNMFTQLAYHSVGNTDFLWRKKKTWRVFEGSLMKQNAKFLCLYLLKCPAKYYRSHDNDNVTSKMWHCVGYCHVRYGATLPCDCKQNTPSVVLVHWNAKHDKKNEARIHWIKNVTQPPGFSFLLDNKLFKKDWFIVVIIIIDLFKRDWY